MIFRSQEGSGQSLDLFPYIAISLFKYPEPPVKVNIIVAIWEYSASGPVGLSWLGLAGHIEKAH